MAQYKTIALELIQDSPELYERLRSTKRLLPSMDAYALDLRTSHDAWKERISRQEPGRDPRQITAEALELAIEGLRRSLCASETSGEEPLSLDAAMATLLRATPPA